jgi:photosystem II stability/assembly factor-like uncharacterized protein
MKKNLLISIVMLSFLFTNVKAQWGQMNSYYDNKIFCFATSANSSGGTNLFAGTYNGGVVLSTDNGKSWTGTTTFTGLVGITVRSLVTIPDSSGGTNLFAGTEKGLYLSTDNAVNWKKIDIGETTYPIILSLVTCANDSGGTNLFAGTTNGGIYLSTDNGTSWKMVGISATTTNVTSLAIITNGSTTNLFAGTNGDGVFLSTNYGTSWTEVNTGITDSAIEVLFVDGSNLLAGTQLGGVFKSLNNGTSWTQLTKTGLTSPYIQYLTIKDSSLYAATDYGVFSLSNNDTTWNKLDTGFTNVSTNAITTVSDGSGGKNLLAGTLDGFFISADNGANWKMSNVGITNLDARALIVSDDTNLIVGTSLAGIKATTNAGTNWKSIAAINDIVAFATRTSGADSTYFFAGTSGNGIYLSTDKGKNWEKANSGLANLYVRTLLVNGTKLYAGTQGGVFVSTDNAKTWTNISTSLTSTDVYALAVIANNIFAGINTSTSGMGVFLSNDNGATWTSVSSGLEYYSGGYNQVNCMVANSTDVFVGSWGIFRSTNNGTSWTNSKDSIGKPYITSFLATGTNIFAGASAGEIYLSKNGGVSWTKTGSNFHNASLYTLTTCPDGKGGTNLLAGTSCGVWVRPMVDFETGIKSTLRQMPKNALLQTFSDPFSSQTTINFSVAEHGQVSLKMFNSMGRKVATLVNGQKPKGDYSIKWNTSGLPGGIYFCKFQNVGKSEVRKMLLQK